MPTNTVQWPPLLTLSSNTSRISQLYQLFSYQQRWQLTIVSWCFDYKNRVTGFSVSIVSELEPAPPRYSSAHEALQLLSHAKSSDFCRAGRELPSPVPLPHLHQVVLIPFPPALRRNDSFVECGYVLLPAWRPGQLATHKPLFLCYCHHSLTSMSPSSQGIPFSIVTPFSQHTVFPKYLLFL